MPLATVLQCLRSNFGKLLLFALAISCLRTASAQTYSPTPAMAGTPITFTVGSEPTNAFSYLFSIYGPAPGNALITSGGTPLVNGVSTFTTTLPAGKYQLEISVELRNSPNQNSFYYFTVYGSGDSDLAALQGQYAFQLAGAAYNVPGGASLALGSLTADGKGNITAGVIDSNTPGAVLQGLPVTGTYQLNASGTGNIYLTSSQGNYQFSLLSPNTLSTSLTPIITGIPYPPYPTSTYLPGATLTATAGQVLSAGGTLQQILPPNASFSNVYILPTLNATFHATFQGVAEQPKGLVPLSGASQFVFDSSGNVTSRGTTAANAITFDYPGLTGTYTPFDSTTGRATMTLPSAVPGGAPAESFALYQLNDGASFFFISLMPQQQTGAIAGRGDQQ